METGASDVYTDVLFVGLTRPATMLGIPLTAFVIEFMATGNIFLAVGNPLYLLLALPIHAVLYLISANDPGAFSSFDLDENDGGVAKPFLGVANFRRFQRRRDL